MKLQVKGYISVYLCLILAVLIPLIATIIEAARFSAMKLDIECAVDIGMDSVLAEYNRELFEEYDLFFVDTSYGESIGNTDNTVEHFDDYLSYNLDPDKNLIVLNAKDLFDLNAQNTRITKIARATDNNGEVFRFAVMQYMLEYYQIAYIQDIQDMVESVEESEINDIDINADSEASNLALSSFNFPEDDGNDYSDVSIDNPSEGLESVKSLGILNIVAPGKDISSKSINPDLYASHRDLINGDGLFFDETSYDFPIMNILVNEYVMQKCGYFDNVKDNGLLDYQVEYVIAGKSNDTDNLKSIADRLLLLRGGANTIYFMSDSELKEEAKTMAEGLALLIECPSLSTLFEGVITTAWISAESIYDVKLLFSGKNVPLFTSKESWDLSLENALCGNLVAIEEAAGISDDNDDGVLKMNYADYLRLFLYFTGKDDVAMRTMDIIEMDVRKNTGNDYFRMDDCAFGFEIQTVITSGYGYEFMVSKEFGYW